MSALTLQQALRAAHFNLMEQDSRVFVMGEDVGILGGAFGITAGLLQRFGARACARCTHFGSSDYRRGDRRGACRDAADLRNAVRRFSVRGA